MRAVLRQLVVRGLNRTSNGSPPASTRLTAHVAQETLPLLTLKPFSLLLLVLLFLGANLKKIRV